MKTYRRPDPLCIGCQGSGLVRRVGGICPCTQVCEDHMDVDATPCDPEECPLDPQWADLTPYDKEGTT